MVYTYTGLGYLIPVVLGLGLLVLIFLGFDVVFDDRWTVTALFIFVATACWFAGRALNPRDQGREKIPSFRHHERKVIAPHELLSLRMEYWAPILAVLGIVYYVYVTLMLHSV